MFSLVQSKNSTRHTLPAQTVDIVDLKDELLIPRVCTLKFPAVESHFPYNIPNTELHCTVVLARKVVLLDIIIQCG